MFALWLTKLVFVFAFSTLFFLRSTRGASGQRRVVDNKQVIGQIEFVNSSNQADFQGLDAKSVTYTVNIPTSYWRYWAHVGFSIVDIEFSMDNTGEYEWHVTQDNSPLDVNPIILLEMYITFYKNNVRFSKLTVNYYILENVVARGLSGSFNYADYQINGGQQAKIQQLVNGSIVVGSNEIIRSIYLFVSGYKKTKSGTAEEIIMSAEVIRHDNSAYDFVFSLPDSTPGNTIDTVYYNYIEHYSMENEELDQILDKSFISNTYSLGASSQGDRQIEGGYTLLPFIPTYSFFGLNSIHIDSSSTIAAIKIQPNFLSDKTNFKYIAKAGSVVKSVSAVTMSIYYYECLDPNELFSYTNKKCDTVCDLKTFLYYYYHQVHQCAGCDPSCKTCSDSSATDCLSCFDQYKLVGTSCVINANDSYCDASNNCTACDSTKNCNHCQADLTTCLDCAAGYYFFQGQCLSSPPARTICQSYTLVCETCPDASYYFYDQKCHQISPEPFMYCDSSLVCVNCTYPCKECSSSATTCTSCYSDFYLYNGQCLQNQPPETYCDSNNICVDCVSPCLECSTSATSCTSCSDGKILDTNTNTCTSSDNSTDAKSSLFTIKTTLYNQQSVSNASSAFGKISQASIYMSLAYSLSSAFLSTGTPLISQLLTIQKAFYIILMNVTLPDYLYEFISALSGKFNSIFYTIFNLQNLFVFSENSQIESKDKGVLQQFSTFNLLSGTPSESEIDTIGYKFQDELIPSDFYYNAGGAVIVVIIIILTSLIFMGIERTRFSRVGLLVYDKGASGFFVELLSIIILMFTLSIAISAAESNSTEAGAIILIILCSIYIIGILVCQTKYLYQMDSKTLTGSSVKDILIEKALKECKKEKIEQRVYMTAFLLIECVLFPAIIVAARSNSIAAVFSFLVIQIAEAYATFKIQPFTEKRENTFFIIEQILFVLIFFCYMIIVLLLYDVDINSDQYNDAVDVFALILTILIIVSVILNPIQKTQKVIVFLQEFVMKRRLNSQKQELADKNRPKVFIESKTKIVPQVQELALDQHKEELITPAPESANEKTDFFKFGTYNEFKATSGVTIP